MPEIWSCGPDRCPRGLTTKGLAVCQVFGSRQHDRSALEEDVSGPVTSSVSCPTSSRTDREICSARGRFGACGAQISRTVPKDSVVARRCSGMGSIVVPGVDGGELVRAQFLTFYDAAVGPLFGYLYRATGGQRELAEDLCQDVFATVLTRVRGGDVSVLTVPWVIAVGRNRLIDQWRRSVRHERRMSQLSANQPVAEASNDDLLAWIAQLPASQQAAVVLHYLDDLPVNEVAARLGKSYKSTESLLSRARRSLRTSGGGDHV